MIMMEEKKKEEIGKEKKEIKQEIKEEAKETKAEFKKETKKEVIMEAKNEISGEKKEEGKQKEKEKKAAPVLTSEKEEVKTEIRGEKEEKKKIKEKEKIQAKKPADVSVTPLTTKDPFDVLQFVLMTEKAVRIVEAQNKLVFIVGKKAKKPEIRNAVESLFESKVSKVTTMIDQKGRKKAFIKFSEAGAAGNIAVRLGII